MDFDNCEGFEDCISQFSFETVLKGGLTFIGAGGVVIALITIAFVLQSWFGPAKTIAKGAMAAGAAIGEIIRSPPSSPLLALLITSVVMVAQLVALGICFLSGNYFGAFFNEQRGEQLTSTLQAYRWQSLDLQPLQALFRWDAYSATYVVLGAILILLSYRRAFRTTHASQDTIGTIMAAPAALFACLAGIGVAIGLAIVLPFTLLIAFFTGQWGDIREDLGIFLPIIVAVLTCAIFWAACVAAVRGSNVVVRAWRGSTASVQRP